MTDKIGFIGLGHMGGAMADRLIDTGNKLVVFDKSPAARDRLGARGAQVATSARDVADLAPVVFSCLPSQEASLAVAREISGGGAIEVYLESSTIGRKTIAAIAEILAATKIGLLDAPVSGGPDPARAGTLAIMVAGPAAAVERARPALEGVAGNIFVVGDKPGVGQVCKVANNAIALTTFLLSCEAMVFGVKAGADATAQVDVINASSGRSSATVDKIPQHILTRTFDYGASMKSAVKDFELYLEEAREMHLPAWCVNNAVELYRLAVDQVGPNEDFTSFITFLEKFAGVEVKGRT